MSSELQRHLADTSARPLADEVSAERAGGYRGYRELLERWRHLEERGARVRPIGSSVRGAPLFAVEIGPEVAPVTSVILAGVHPIEWIGVETGLALLERLVADPPHDRTVLAVPLINVDGYRLVESDLRAGRRRWRRGNANNVDLNRNYPTHFKANRFFGLQRLLAGYNHGGAHALSEPEIAAVVAALDRAHARSRIDVAVTLHSVGRMLLTPYGGVWRAPADAQRIERAARAVRDRLPERYRIKQSSRWVPGAFAHGMDLDHLHARYGAIALLVECSGGGLRVRDPGTWTVPFRWFNPPDPGVVADGLAVGLEPFIRSGSLLGE